MQEETIQTLHPDPKKKNKKISKVKYDMVKESMLALLEGKSLAHSELFVALDTMLKDKFHGAIGWYAETVKLDLEARKIIERTTEKPQKYKIV